MSNPAMRIIRPLALPAIAPVAADDLGRMADAFAPEALRIAIGACPWAEATEELIDSLSDRIYGAAVVAYASGILPSTSAFTDVVDFLWTRAVDLAHVATQDAVHSLRDAGVVLFPASRMAGNRLRPAGLGRDRRLG